MNEVVFIKGQGGLGRPLPGADFISALLCYTNTLPSGFASTDRIKKVLSLEDAVNLGITNTHIGETKASGTITVTGAGAANDTIAVKVDGVTIATAVVPASPTTTTVATSIASAINAATLTNGGYTATSASAVCTITQPAGFGKGGNSKILTNTITGTATTTIVTFAGGVASVIDNLHYIVSEYFRLQPKGELWIGLYATGSTTFTEIKTISDFTGGKIRQTMVFINDPTVVAFATSQVTAMQVVATQLASEFKPQSIIYAPDLTAVSDLSTLSDLRALNAPNVSVFIGMDGAAKGQSLYYATTKSVPSIGAVLGALSLSKVSEDIAWVEKYNLSDGTENDTAMFSNGTLFRAVSSTLLDDINNKGYIFFRKIVDVDGTYLNDSHTAVAITSDYAYIENERTIDKATRVLRKSLIPKLNSPLKVNPDGTLEESTIQTFLSLANAPLEQMLKDEEVSAYKVTINPVQNVLATSKLIIAVAIIPFGVARQIQVNIGYTVSITA